jgi:hypothetical protein
MLTDFLPLLREAAKAIEADLVHRPAGGWARTGMP